MPLVVVEFAGTAIRYDEPARHLVHALRTRRKNPFTGIIQIIRDMRHVPGEETSDETSSTTTASLLDVSGATITGVELIPVIIKRLMEDRLASPASVDLSYSINALQYLSVRPQLSIHSIYASEDSEIRDSFKQQAQLDLIAFLRSRAVELKPGAPLLISLMLADSDPLHAGGEQLLNFLSKACLNLKNQGIITDEIMSALTLPVYLRSDEDINAALSATKDVLFVQDYTDRFIHIPAWDMWQEGTVTVDMYAKAAVAMLVPMIRRWARQVLVEFKFDVDAIQNILDALQEEWRIIVGRNRKHLLEGRFRFGYLRLERL